MPHKEVLEVKQAPEAPTVTEDVKLKDISLSVQSTSLKTMARNAEKYTLRFEDIRVSVSVPSWMPEFATPGVPGQTKQILKGISGSASSGEVLAIIGASGSGKTTLLDQLAHQPLMSGGEFSGTLTVNEQPMTNKFFKAHCAYVHQDDRLWGALTVYENLENAAKLYSPNISAEERKDRIEMILEATGLQSCKHTKVGNVLIKGISGGQRRRVSIAVELMGSPAILFLDEPTSGLDSKSAAEIMELLNQIAKRLNVLIVCSIHQPSTRTFLAFDLTLLLSKGKVAYFGPAKSSLSYFEKLGFTAPAQMNPADFLIEISNPDFTSPEQVNDLIAKWDAQYETERKEKEGTGSDTDKVEPKQGSPYASSFFWQVFVLTSRMTKSYVRDPGAYIGRAVLYTTMSTIFGIIYLGAREKSQEHVLDILFAIAWGMATPSYMATMIMPVFTYESATFAKEAKNGMYAPGAYVLASSLVQTIFVLFTSTLSVVPYYWIVNINDDPARFFQFWLLQYVFLYTIESLCIVFASVIPNFVIALGVVVSTLSNFFVFNGLFVTPDSVPWVFRWIEYISPHRYAMQGLSFLAFSGQSFSGFDTCTASCFGDNGDDVLDNIQGLSSDTNVGLMFGVLIAEAVVLRLAHWFILRKA
uniref:ABC transporter domain-containing protein n=1 Tax=Lotharella globosa TaxID=91324 RepID=A0A7S3YAG1_9EUKA|mmetsp:Transcript_9777/g.19250  ORF Transcript_9777/g.19250 Transcript_9777/m.19250 type:complete len:642 (+) Transcript_9777:103-2028(+)